MTDNTRTSYGQGAQGEKESPTTTSVGVGTRLRYYFDNSLSKAGYFVLYAFILLTILSAITTAFRLWIYGTPLANEADPNDFINNVIARMFEYSETSPPRRGRIASRACWRGLPEPG